MMKSILRFKWSSLLLLLGLAIGLTVVIDIIRISTYTIHPQDPTHKIRLRQDQVYADLTNGAKDIDWARLDGTLEFINSQYDCSDFRW